MHASRSCIKLLALCDDCMMWLTPPGACLCSSIAGELLASEALPACRLVGVVLFSNQQSARSAANQYNGWLGWGSSGLVVETASHTSQQSMKRGRDDAGLHLIHLQSSALFCVWHVLACAWITCGLYARFGTSTSGLENALCSAATVLMDLIQGHGY